MALVQIYLFWFILDKELSGSTMAISNHIPQLDWLCNIELKYLHTCFCGKLFFPMELFHKSATLNSYFWVVFHCPQKNFDQFHQPLLSLSPSILCLYL